MLPSYSSFNTPFLPMHIVVLLCGGIFRTVPSAVLFHGCLQEEKATEQF